jgi:hypothetical protein
LSDFQGLPASGCVAADTRKMLFRYSRLCGTASDAVDAVILPRRIKIGNPDLLGRLVGSKLKERSPKLKAKPKGFQIIKN